MASFGRTIGKQATKATLRHSVRGFASKAQRKPFRSLTLLSVGGAVGATAGWFVGRKSARALIAKSRLARGGGGA